MSVEAERDRVIAEALTWLGTPFRHGARARGAGVDCGQFLYACFVDTGVVEPFAMGFYSPDWWKHRESEEVYLRELPRAWTEIPIESIERADLLLFQQGRGLGHAGLYLGGDRMIHAPSYGVAFDLVRGHPHWASHLRRAYRVTRWAAGFSD